MENESGLENRDRLKAELKSLVEKEYAGSLENADKIALFAQGLKMKYDNLEEYELFHILALSTVPKDRKLKYFDLPHGEIEKFIRSFNELQT